MINDETQDLCQKEFFNEKAEKWLDMFYADPETGKYDRYEKEFKRLFGLAGLKEGNRVLDLGCGSGVLVPHILERIGADGRLLEVDYAENMIAVNRRLHQDKRVSFLLGSADELTLPPESYDCAFCFSCFPHFRNKPKALKAIEHSLKLGGKLILAHFDSAKNINHHHAGHECVKHAHLPNETDMSALIGQSGFHVERFIDETGFYFLGAVKGC